MTAGLEAIIARYDAYGPLAAAFLANLLATFGDKGQLVVVTLATRYDWKRVFVGATAAFALWSAVEVAFGRYVVRVLPAAVITAVTGGLFLAFGAWTLVGAVDRYRREHGSPPLLSSGGIDVGISGRLLPATVLDRVGAYGGVVTSFGFILLAEFGDKTQLLTINLAATFPDSPVAVFVGVVAALALRTGVDAAVGEQFERRLPTVGIELFAAAVFVVFGLLVFGIVPVEALLAVLALAALAGAGWAIREARAV